MQIEVFFGEKTLLFAGVAGIPRGFSIIDLDAGKQISRTKVLKFFETRNYLALRTAAPEEAYERFSRQFLRVEAAGGVVLDDEGRWLMIHWYHHDEYGCSATRSLW